MAETPIKQLDIKLLESSYDNRITPEENATPQIKWDQFSYKQIDNAPKIKFEGVVLILLSPILISLHIIGAKYTAIPYIQYAFVTTLVAFILNYTMIIRKYQLMPYLDPPVYDNRLKLLCILALIGILFSLKWGWNGSSGMIFASIWELRRQSAMGIYAYIFLLIGCGSLLMEEYYGWNKILEFIPGLIFGYITSTVFTMKKSSFYAMAHQFLFLSCMTLPMFFPASKMIVPTIWQWLFMIITGLTVLFTVIITIVLMQRERVSVVVAALSGILMLGTSLSIHVLDVIGGVMVFVGLIWMIKKQYYQIRY